MSKPRKVKCPVCGSLNDKEVAVLHNGRHYCEICFENKKKESQDYKNLITYICELYNIDCPTGWMLKQIKDFKETYNYTYKGMKTTLNYFFTIKTQNEPEEAMGIGIIPYVYDETKKYYYDLKTVRDSVRNTDIEELANRNRIIKIKKTDIAKKETYKDTVLIDISEL